MSALRAPELAPAAMRPLSEVLTMAPAGREPAPGLGALVHGEACQVTAVLERTAVFEDSRGERHLARHAEVLVDPAEIRWQAPAFLPAGLHWRGHGPANRRATRRASDQRALVDQARHAADDAVPAPGRATASSPTAAIAPPAPAPCEGCGRPLPAHNHSGRCVPCQRVCPVCDGPKTVEAARCRRCSAPAQVSSVAERALQDLQELIAELGDHVVTMGRYARELEDELELTRAELRRLQRRVEASAR